MKKISFNNLYFVWCFQWLLFGISAAQESPENIFHQTVTSWQKLQAKNDWGPWYDFCNKLWAQFDETKKTNNRLQIIGALEEGILAIERVVFQQSQGTNAARDRALSKLYTTYATSLMDLNEEECLSLALDAHTLLIGVETVDKSKPSTYLCIENAENSLRNAASLDATNVEAETLLLKVTGGKGTIHERKPKEFVAELFDSFADTFDNKLLNSLEYKVPALVGELAKNLSSSYHAVLDAGCGTGLVGRYIKPLLLKEGVIVGVDASQKMLDKAKLCTLESGCGLEVKERKDSQPPSRRLYDGLVKMDLEEMTIENLATEIGFESLNEFDLVVAADVLVYFGSLKSLMQTFSSVSSPNSKLIFSCELATEKEAPLGWRLLTSGRFAHTRHHAIASAEQAGFQLVHYEEITPRIEHGEPVRGHLFAFELGVGYSSEL